MLHFRRFGHIMLLESSQCPHTQTEGKAVTVAILCFIWPDYGSTDTTSVWRDRGETFGLDSPIRKTVLMCDRYVRRSDKQRIAEHLHVYGPSIPHFGPSWNVAPQTFQPVVRLNRDTREREIVMMRWGFIPYWAKDPQIGLSTINAKAETVATAPSFREAFKQRRCLVPADVFLGWQKIDAKTKTLCYRIEIW
jgi:hypothetical protein